MEGSLVFVLVLAILVYIALCVAASYLAGQKGYTKPGFFFLAFFVSPLFAMLVIACLPDRVLCAKIDALLGAGGKTAPPQSAPAYASQTKKSSYQMPEL